MRMWGCAALGRVPAAYTAIGDGCSSDPLVNSGGSTLGVDPWMAEGTLGWTAEHVTDSCKSMQAREEVQGLQ